MMKSRALLLLSVALPLAACGADDISSPGEGVIIVPAPTPPAPPPAPPPPPSPPPTTTPGNCPSGTTAVGEITTSEGTLRNCQLPTTITGDLSLPRLRGVIYSVNGRTQVGVDVGADGNRPGGDRASLTLDPGVTLFGENALSFLLVTRGSQLFAEGTATAPIVMTSRQNVVGSATDESIGQWGGLVMLGRAPIESCSDAAATPGSANCQSQIEGTSGEAFFGGGVADDSSGRIRFLQVRYAGFEVTEGNELNAISLGGIGSGTVMNNVQVHNGSDDGFEWFGGRVNHRYLVATGIDDDSFDVDEGYKGAVQYALAVQRGILPGTAAAGDKLIEGESGGDDQAVPRTRFELANVTFLGSGRQDGIQLRGGMDFTLVNSIVVVPGNECFDIDDPGTIQTSGTDEEGPPVFAGVVVECSAIAADDSNVTRAQIEAIFNAGPQTALADITLTELVFPPSSLPVTAVDPKQYNSFFDTTNYIGAFRDAQDRWFNGWTCGLPGQPSCTTIPSSGSAT